MFNPVLCVCVC